MIFTQGIYGGEPFPTLTPHFIERLNINLNSFYTLPSGIKAYPCAPHEVCFIKISTCIDFSQVPFRFRDKFEETGIGGPGDADMWMRIRELVLNQTLLPSIYIDSLTCANIDEGYSKTHA